MRKLMVAVLLAASVGTVAGPAHAAPMELTGNPCSLLSVADTAPDEWTGLLYSEPQKLSHVAGSPVVSGSLRCTLKVNAPTHLDPGLVSTQGPVTPGVAVAPPVPVTYHAGLWDMVSVCAQVDIVGEGTYYWADWANVGYWSTDPSVVCTDNSLVYVFPPYWNRIFEMLDTAIMVVNAVVDVVNPVLESVDTVVCPQLVALAPGAGPVTIAPDGDTYIDGELWYDCPPYQSS